MGGAIVKFRCDHAQSENASDSVCYGHYFRKDDGRIIQRFRCGRCFKTFSSASSDPCFRQKKRTLNKPLAALLVSGVSQRRLARLLSLNRKTIARKLVFLGKLAFRELTHSNLLYPKASVIEFDDLETFEHTKLKPLSVTLAVEYQSRRILGFRVSQMPAKGLIARMSVNKYGERMDKRAQGRSELFCEIKDMIQQTATIKSDQNPHYPKDVKNYFPEATHDTYRSRRAAVVGQGELKKIGFDPLFSLNHTCAMLRANINRLFRKTWCTTKRPDRLALHIALYAVFHNADLKTS